MQGNSGLCNSVPAQDIVARLITAASGHKIMMSVCWQPPTLTLLSEFGYVIFPGLPFGIENGQVLQTFDQQLALGAVLTPHPIIRWHNRLDITPPSLGTSLEIGSETIAARVGSTFAFSNEAPSQSWSLGFSLNQLGKQLHYTYLNQENLEHKHLVSIGMSFGGDTIYLTETRRGHRFKCPASTRLRIDT